MPKFTITTLGCKVNQAESEAIVQQLQSMDWSTTADGGAAEVCIVNTCTVTQKASMQSRQAIRKAIRSNPKARIIVTGCYAQTAPQEINNIKGIDEVVGHDEKAAIDRLITRNADADQKIPRIEPGPMPAATARTRPFVKIQDGCDAFCTYCIVPYARGRSRSMPPKNVLQRIEQLAQAGFHEVVLTGIHLGAYGHDLVDTVDLATLLQCIGDRKLIDRVRLSSIEPLELSRNIIDTVTNSAVFCRHFHIPLQSGDDEILAKMGRPYSRQMYHEIITHIHKLMPDAAIGADILIGFPGESEIAFDNTLDLISSLPLSYLHVFPYSARPGTPAADMADQIPPERIKARCEQMRRLGQAKRMDFYRKFIGKRMPLLIEAKRDRTTGLLKGLSSNYLPVFVAGGDELKSRIVDVRIEKLAGTQLFGTLI